MAFQLLLKSSQGKRSWLITVHALPPIGTVITTLTEPHARLRVLEIGLYAQALNDPPLSARGRDFQTEGDYIALVEELSLTPASGEAF